MPQTVSTAQLHTFLIADVRGYTRFTLEYGDVAAADLATCFADQVERGVSMHGGQVVELRGDEALVVFSSARNALQAALELQQRFSEASTAEIPLKVGIGIDAGEAIPVKAGYRGAALNLAARLCSLAGPGEVLISETVANLARRTEGVEYVPRGSVLLKGFTDAVEVLQVLSPSEVDTGTRNVSDSPSSAFTATSLSSLPMSPHAAQQIPIGGFLGALPEGAQAERELEMDQVLRTVNSVLDARGKLLLLTGEPGVGKTRLAQEITLQIRNRGFLVAAGRCYSTREAVPFYPFYELLATVFVEASHELRACAAERWPYLARLLPDFPLDVARDLTSGPEDQDRLFRAVAGFVTAVASETPVALLLDDLHWADSASLELLEHLARETRASRVLLVGTYRDGEVNRQHPLSRTLRQLTREGLSDEITLRRMSVQGTEALIALVLGETSVSEEFVALLHGRTDGNPFFVREVLRALVERGDIFQRDDGSWDRAGVLDIEVPHSVREAIGERLSRLNENVQDLLHQASVLGQSFHFEDLQELSGLDEETVERSLSAFEAAGLIRTGAHDAFTFGHALIQQTLYEEIPARRRRRLHRATGEALERAGGQSVARRAGELTWHFLQGDDPERALTYSLMAGDGALAVFAYLDAIELYRTAAGLARDLDDDTKLACALEGLGVSYLRDSQYEDAFESLEDAASAFRRLHDRVGEARVVGWIGHGHHMRGSPESGVRRVRALLDEIGEDVSAAVLAPLYVALAHLYFASGRYTDQLHAAEQASTHAREAGDAYSLAAAELRLGTAYGMLGQYEEAVRIVRGAVPLAEECGDLHTLAVALNNLGDFMRGLGFPGEGMVYRDRSLETVKQVGDMAGLAYSYGMCGWSYFEIGDTAKAEEYLEAGIKVAGIYPSSWRAPYAYAHCGRWLGITGSYDRAEQYLQLAIATATEGNDLQGSTYATVSLAILYLQRERPAHVQRLLEPLLDKEIWLAPEICYTCADAYLMSGLTDEALVLANRAVSIAHDGHTRFYEAHAKRARGNALLATGSPDAAYVDLEESVSRFREMGMPFDLGWCLYDLGRADILHDEPRSHDRLREALQIFSSLGAVPFSALTTRALAELSK